MLTTRTRRTSLSRSFDFFKPEDGTMPPDKNRNLPSFSPSPPFRNTLQVNGHALNCAHGSRFYCTCEAKGACFVRKEKAAAATRVRVARASNPAAPLHPFHPPILAETSGSRRSCLFLCRDPARRSSSHRLLLTRVRGGPRPGPPPATSHSAGRAVSRGGPTHTRLRASTRPLTSCRLFSPHLLQGD